MADSDLAWRISCFATGIRYDISARRVLATGAETIATYEAKYRADQSRAPKGTPEGGQWVVDPARARQQRLRNERIRLSELTPFGNLMRELILPDGSRLCVCDFGSQKWVVGGGSGRHIGCAGQLHQSAVFPLGMRLNDN